MKCCGGRRGMAASTEFEGKGGDDIVVCPPSSPLDMGMYELVIQPLLRFGWVDFGNCCFGVSLSPKV